MVQILPRNTTARDLSQNIGSQITQAVGEYSDARMKQKAAEELALLADPNTSSVVKANIISRRGDIKDIMKFNKEQSRQSLLDEYRNITNPEALDTARTGQPDAAAMSGLSQPPQEAIEAPWFMKPGVKSSIGHKFQVPPKQAPQISPEEREARTSKLIEDLGMIDPQTAGVLQRERAQRLQEKQQIQKGEEYKRRAFESERDYNEKKSADFRKTISGLRQSIPRKENALNLARNALESEDLSMFSADHLADIFNLPGLRTASGAALNLAIKENLFSNLTRVSAKAQNMWLEKVMSSAFAQKGQTLEANMTVQEALEAELALDKAETEIYNQLAQEDMKKQGYEGGDIEARVFKAMEPFEKEIRDRMSYRTRVIYEKEKGIKKLMELANKKAPKDTPLTRNMFQIFLRKTGSPEKAIQRAKELGYVIYPNEKVQEYTK